MGPVCHMWAGGPPRHVPPVPKAFVHRVWRCGAHQEFLPRAMGRRASVHRVWRCGAQEEFLPQAMGRPPAAATQAPDPPRPRTKGRPRKRTRRISPATRPGTRRSSYAGPTRQPGQHDGPTLYTPQPSDARCSPATSPPPGIWTKEERVARD